ncbi:hypothetical protein GCM10007977_106660 [Dactylosporangium sucinum]|uniref:Fibronectin type-III domain-containing protein n=1 Tax=Dactylosporangium sucinum TaxID=1424081 RepID=A0A917UEI8_9ACTN|nr:hypothetical protein GCM10007977_106660 [Dactylosporangium sucinum]
MPLLLAVVAGATLSDSPATAAPSAPQVPAAVLAPPQVSGTSVTLSWTDQSPDEDEFWVFRHDAAGGPFSLVTSVPSTSTTGTGTVYSTVDTVPAGTRQCYAVTTFVFFGRIGDEFSTEQCTSELPGLPVPPAGPGGITTVDLPPDNRVKHGFDPTGVIGRDGHAVFAYYLFRTPSATRNLRVAWCRDDACTSVTATTIDDFGWNGLTPAIAIAGDGLPVVAYVTKYDDHTAYDLKVAKCLTPTCTAASTQFVDRNSVVRGDVSITIGPDGLPLIAYEDRPSETQPAKVKVVKCFDHHCTSSRQSIVDTVGPDNLDGQTGTAIATLPTGLAILAYHDGAPYGDLKVARCHDTACTASTTVTVDSGPGTTGGRPSITVGRDGLAIIAHERRDPTEQLVVSHCVNVLCTATTNTVLDTTGATYTAPSITIGADGLPIVAYTHESGPSLRVAHCENLACTTATRSTVETNGTLGWQQPTILTAPDNRPMIGYFDQSRDALRIVDCGNVLCRPPFN